MFKQAIEMGYSNGDCNNNLNYQEFRLKLQAVVTNLKLDYALWRKEHTVGGQLVMTITEMHAKCLMFQRNLPTLRTARHISAATTKLIRLQRDMQSPMERLHKVIKQLLDANDRTRNYLRQVKQWMMEFGNCIIYMNWSLKDLLHFLDEIVLLYEYEYEIKEMVVENITNMQNLEELQMLRIAWRVTRHALTPEFNAMFEEFNIKSKHVK